MTSQPSKEQLENLKKGGLKAFEAVFSLYEKPIFYYIYSIVKRREDAEDIFQEVFIKLYKSAGRIDLENNFKNWLYKIAANTVYDWLRKKQRNREIFAIDDGGDFETICPDSSYLLLDGKQDVGAALARIKPEYRAALMLLYYEGMAYEEIADALSIPLNTAKTHIRRAKEALKKEL